MHGILSSCLHLYLQVVLRCCKILLICPGHIYGQRTNLMGLYVGVEGEGRLGTYIWEEKHFNLQFLKFTLLSFFQYKAHVLAFFTFCKMRNIGGRGSGGWELIFGRKNTSICNLLNLLFLFFFSPPQYKAHVLAFFTMCKM